MTIDLRLLASINVGTDADDIISMIADYLADGTIGVAFADGDLICRLALTEAGKAMLPPRLPTTTA